jgi:hypothetical protein
MGYQSWWIKNLWFLESTKGWIHVKRTHCQLLFTMLKNNGLTNQYERVELDWLFKENIIGIIWKKINIMTQKDVALILLFGNT